MNISKWALLGAALIFASNAAAQSMPQVETFAGFSYVSADANGLVPRQSMYGWETGASSELRRHIAVEGNFSGYRKGNLLGSGINVSDYAVAAGPHFAFHQFFFHSLFGVDRLTGTAPNSGHWLFGIDRPTGTAPSSVSASQNSFALIEGGGVQVKVAPHVSVRTSADWALTHHNIFAGPRFDQNNFRVSVGLVFSFGGTARGALAERGAAAVPLDPACGMPSTTVHAVALEDVGLAGEPNTYGMRITAIAPNSSAQRAGLLVGDYIVSVNCATVRTGADVAAALSRSPGIAVVMINKSIWLPNHTEVHRLQVNANN